MFRKNKKSITSPTLPPMSSPVVVGLDGKRHSRSGTVDPSAAYRTVKKLGEGGFGVCYLVEDDAGNPWVLKKIKCKDHDEMVEALKEMVMMRICQSSSVVGFKEFYKNDTTLEVCLIMEYCEEGDLFHKVKAAYDAKSPLSESQVLRWLVQCLFGLRDIHSNSFVHRDLKPGNIFLSRWDIVKLGDFGLGTLLDRMASDGGGGGSGGGAAAAAAAAGGTVGTIGFMAPEVRNGEPYDAKCDVFALGCCLYEMVTLRSAYYDTINDYFPQRVPAHYSEELADLLLRMLAPSRKHRPSVDDLLGMKILKPLVQPIRDEQELIAKVLQMEERIGYIHFQRHKSAAKSLVASFQTVVAPLTSIMPTAASGSASSVNNTVTQMVGWIQRVPLAQMLLEDATSGNLIRSGIGIFEDGVMWLHSSLFDHARLQELAKRIEKNVNRGYHLCHMISWFPLLLALVGFLFGRLLSAVQQLALLCIVIIVIPMLTATNRHQRPGAVSVLTRRIAMDVTSTCSPYVVTCGILRADTRSDALQLLVGLVLVLVSCTAYYTACRADMAGASVGGVRRVNLQVTTGITLAVSLTAAVSKPAHAAHLMTAAVYHMVCISIACVVCVCASHFLGMPTALPMVPPPMHAYTDLVFTPVGTLIISTLLYVTFVGGVNVLTFLVPIVFFVATMYTIETLVLRDSSSGQQQQQQQEQQQQKKKKTTTKKMAGGGNDSWWPRYLSDEMTDKMLLYYPYVVAGACISVVILSVATTL